MMAECLIFVSWVSNGSVNVLLTYGEHLVNRVDLGQMKTGAERCWSRWPRVCCNNGMDVVEGVCNVVSGVGFTLISWSCRDGGQNCKLSQLTIVWETVSSSFSEYRRYLSFLYPPKVRRKASLLIEMVRVSQSMSQMWPSWEMYRILSKISSTRCTRWLVGTQFVPGYIASSELW